MSLLQHHIQKSNRAELRVFIDWRGYLAANDGGSIRPATALDLIQVPRPSRRADGFREED